MGPNQTTLLTFTPTGELCAGTAAPGMHLGRWVRAAPPKPCGAGIWRTRSLAAAVSQADQCRTGGWSLMSDEHEGLWATTPR